MKSEIFKKITKDYIRKIRSNVFQEKKNHNELGLKQYREIKPLLIQICENGDIKMLDIVLNKEIENIFLCMTCKINKSNKTASLFRITRKNRSKK